MEPTPDQTLQQLMFSLIELWKDSEKTQQEFCREKDLDYAKFHYWLKKYKVSRGERAENKSAQEFIKLDLPPKATSSGLLELCFPDGRRLVFHQPVESSFLRSLLA